MRRAFRRIGAALGLLAGLAILAACQPPAAQRVTNTPGGAAPAAGGTSLPAVSERLKVAWVSASGSYLPFWAGIDLGLFQKWGLEVEPVFTSGPQAVQSLLAREVDIAYTDGAAIVRAALAGGDTVILGSTTNVFPFRVIGVPSLQRVEDLRGKRLGITRQGATTDTAARSLLRRVGLQPDVDVALIQTGTTTEMYSALVAGAIDAGVMSEPVALQAIKDGYRVLFDMANMGVEYPTTALGTLRSLVAERPAALRAFIAGLTEAIARVRQNRAEALEVLARFTRLEDPEVLNATYDEFAPRYPQAPYPTEASIVTILESIRELEGRTIDARPSDFIDPRFVRELDESGVIRSFYP
ncbi:MAG TPA: ABC transporter substrate-binding protein [Chloroflexota bacterium]|nr:ABC transporter substrate-binding protein [Chloroflexota bacterium]